MSKALHWAGTLCGIAGLLVCLASGVLRLLGNYYLAGLPLVTWFAAGAGLLVASCYLKLEAISSRSAG